MYGIKKQVTTTFTLQHNRVLERKNHTILNMVQSLLARSGVPKSLWLEAINWSIHILNKSSTSIVQNMIPNKAWNG